LIERFRFSEFVCLGPDSAGQGHGAPYPLCDGAAPGEFRTGFRLGFYAEPVTVSAADLASFYLPLISDANTPGMDWQVRTIACELESAGCTRAFKLVFGMAERGSQLADPAAGLVFDVRFDSTDSWAITAALLLQGFTSATAEPFLYGGLPGAAEEWVSPGFGEFQPWQP
jgi:hypothetical protein